MSVAGEPACGEWVADSRDQRLRRALREGPIAARRVTDRALASLEACPALKPGLVRVLRAELLPECAEALVSPLLRGGVGRPGAPAEVRFAGEAYALALAARLERFAPTPPRVSAGATTPVEVVRREVRETFQRWATSLTAELGAVGERVHLLPEGSHARSAAELAFGMAWSRMIAALSIPASLGSNAERRTAASLEIESVRRQLIAAALPEQVHAANSVAIATDWWRLGQRQRASGDFSAAARRPGEVLLPPLPPFEASTVNERLAMVLPAWVSPLVLPDADVAATGSGQQGFTPRLLRALLVQGLDPQWRRRLAAVSERATWLLAWARLRLGLSGFEREQFVAAAWLLRGDATPRGRLLGGLAAALATGPDGFASWDQPTLARPLDLGRLEQLRLDATVDRVTSTLADHATALLGLLAVDTAEAAARELARWPERAESPLSSCTNGFVSETGCGCPRFP